MRRCGNSVLRVLCGQGPKQVKARWPSVFFLRPDQSFFLHRVVESVQMEPNQNPCPPQPDSAQERPFFPTARLDFRRPIRLAGADGAPLQQLRDSRASRRKAQSRSRPGRPWRFCPDQLNPFLVYCLVESVQLEPKQSPCPPPRFGTRTASVHPSVWQELMVRRYGNYVIRGLGDARPKAGQGQVDLGVFAQTGSIPSFCVVWLNLCRWNPTRTHVPALFGTWTASVDPSVWQALMVRRCGHYVLCGLA